MSILGFGQNNANPGPETEGNVLVLQSHNRVRTAQISVCICFPKQHKFRANHALFLPFIACDVPCDIKTKWICIMRVFLMFLTSSKTIFRTLWPLI